LINSVGNLGGFLGPFIVGYLRSATGSFAGGMLFLCGSLFLASFLASRITGADRRMPRPGSDEGRK
jgi:ACS family tartrate transporter-like MFS transporter